MQDGSTGETHVRFRYIDTQVNPKSARGYTKKKKKSMDWFNSNMHNDGFMNKSIAIIALAMWELL